jgi:hypothetical protein
MENTNNPDQQPVDQSTGGPLEGMSPQNNADFDNLDLGADGNPEESAVYAGLGLDAGGPDEWNPESEEASDSILYTDTITAQHAIDNVSNDVDYDQLPTDETLDPDEIDRLSPDSAKPDDQDRYLAY